MALIEGTNVRYAGLLRGFDRVLMDVMVGRRPGHPLARLRFNALPPLQRHGAVASGAHLIAGFAALALGSVWERSEDVVEPPLLPGCASTIRQPRLRRAPAKTRRAPPRTMPGRAALPSSEFVEFVSREMRLTRHRLPTAKGRRAFLAGLMRTWQAVPGWKE